MPVRLTSVVFHAVDVDALVYYWTSAFEDWRVESKAGGEVRIVPSEEDGSTLDVTFAPGASEKSGKNRMHLDLNSWGMHEYQANREAIPLIGGQIIDIGQGELVPWTVFADPEGNEFCLLKPRDRYSDAGAVAAVVVDCADPDLLATFWSAATGWDVVERAGDFAILRDPRQPPRGPFLEFARVPGRSAEQGRLCLGFESFWAHQHDEDVARLCALGAKVLRRHEGEVSYSVLADPEGNEFRVVIPVWPPPAPQRWRYEVDGPVLHS